MTAPIRAIPAFPPAPPAPAPPSGVVTALQRFSVHDGPGVRTTVFLKGCPLHCRWCHNPETRDARPQLQFHRLRCLSCGACVDVCPAGCHTIDPSGQHRFDTAGCTRCWKCVDSCVPRALEIVGRTMTIDEILAIVERDRPFYGETGGLTLSGGEPLAQPDFALALLREARARGLGTCVETCGEFPARFVPELLDLCDTLFWDIKDTDPDRLLRNTGGDLGAILARLEQAARLHPERIVLRCLLVEGVNTEDLHLDRVIALARRLSLSRVELLPFHPFGGSKREALGLSEPTPGAECIPSEPLLEHYLTRIRDAGLAG